jgi:hypothetical protein
LKTIGEVLIVFLLLKDMDYTGVIAVEGEGGNVQSSKGREQLY